MKIKMTLQQTKLSSGETEIKDITDMVFNISLETQISDQPGKLSFDCIDDKNVFFNEGAVITFQVDDVGMFYGYVFTSKVCETDFISVTAYDQLRYLQNQDIYVISGLTASQVFEKICKDFQVKNWKVVNESSMILPSYIHDNKTLFSIIDYGIGSELRFNKKWYIIRDNFGTLEFVDLSTLATEFIYSNTDNIFSYSFESTIDEDTYNQIKIYQENRENKKGKAVKSGGKVVSRDYALAENPSTKALWGTLQYCEKSDKRLNPAQLQIYAETILSQKNRAIPKLSLTTQGNLKVSSGSQVFIYIDKVQEKITDRNGFLVTACTHKFENNEHTMSMTLMLPQYGMELK